MHEYNCTIRRVGDGDTVDVDIDLGFDTWIHNERVRLYGIDTPESRTRDLEEKKAGLFAKKVVLHYLPEGSKQILRTYKDKVGKYGRVLGEFVIYDPEQDRQTTINEFMIRHRIGVEYSGKSKEEIKQRTDTLKQTMISLEKTKKAKDKEEKILQKRSSLSEQEIETKKKTVQQSYENIKTLEEQKQNLMKTLNIQSEEDLPSTGFFDRFKRRGGGEQRGGGEGIREYTPNFVMEIFDSFTDQIRGFAEPFIMIKDVVFDLLKPLKLLGKLFMPLIKGFGRLIKTIGLQILSGMALVAINILRLLTDKKVLLGLGALAAILGLKKLFSSDPEQDAKDAQEGKGKYQNLDEMPDKEFDQHFGDDNVPTVSADESRKQRIINSGDPRIRTSANYDFRKGQYKSEEDRNVDVKSLLKPGEENLYKSNIANNTSVANTQTQADNSTQNIVTSDVHNTRNVWQNSIA